MLKTFLTLIFVLFHHFLAKYRNENVNKIINECAYGTIKQIIADDNVPEGNDTGVTELGKLILIISLFKLLMAFTKILLNIFSFTMKRFLSIYVDRAGH